MQFNKQEAEKEIYRLISKSEISLMKSEYPQLSKMLERGQKLSWDEYFQQKRLTK